MFASVVDPAPVTAGAVSFPGYCGGVLAEPVGLVVTSFEPIREQLSDPSFGVRSLDRSGAGQLTRLGSYFARLLAMVGIEV